MSESTSESFALRFLEDSELAESDIVGCATVAIGGDRVVTAYTYTDPGWDA